MHTIRSGIRRWLATAFFAVAGMLPFAALAQGAYPNKPIRIIVAYAAGGVSDVMARLVAMPLGAELGQSVIVDNRVGAGGSIGTQACASAAPDGYTLCMGSQASLILLPMLVKGTKYDPVKDFTPISLIASAASVLVVNSKSNIRNLNELISMIRANPGIGLGTAGVGTTNHLATIYLNKELGLKIEHAPYKGGVLAVQDVLAGHLPMALDVMNTSLPHIHKGTLVALVQTGTTRSPSLPDVPTFAETVLPKFRYDSFQGLLGPAGLPPEVVQKLNAALRKTLTTQQDLRAKIIDMGSAPVTNTPEEFAAQIREQAPIFQELVELAGLKAQ